MLQVQSTAFKTSGVLNTLLHDYLEREPRLNSFYSHFPDLAGFRALIASQPYQDFNRQRLSDILLAQAQSVKNTSDASLAAIKRLARPGAFTVTTGHQLCLFTGPLYFIYKIFSTINLAEELSKEFPDHDFVPVYWMATEDHDFEEINHFHVGDEKIQWQSGQAGAVGDFSTDGLHTLLPELRKALGQSERSKELLDLFERSYSQHQNLADATRYLVNELFRDEALVIIDGNDAEFKKQFVTELEEDLFQHTAFDLISKTSTQLESAGYHVQVHAREINSFYLEPQSRNRIVEEGANYRILNTDQVFSKEALRHLLQEHPERFSPNVVLRPLYQQKILPNLAYVGGPGELAYWLEFKAFFESQAVQFPILMPRNFATIFSAKADKKIEQLKLDRQDFFSPDTTLLKMLQERIHGHFDVSAEEEQLRHVYAGLLQRAINIDKSLENSIQAELQKHLNRLEAISARVSRAQRRKMEEELSAIQYVRASIYAGTVPRERHDNFASYYLQYGPEFFKTIKTAANPLLLRHLLLFEDKR